jgi:hypothetical protein
VSPMKQYRHGRKVMTSPSGISKYPVTGTSMFLAVLAVPGGYHVNVLPVRRESSALWGR